MGLSQVFSFAEMGEARRRRMNFFYKKNYKKYLQNVAKESTKRAYKLQRSTRSLRFDLLNLKFYIWIKKKKIEKGKKKKRWSTCDCSAHLRLLDHQSRGSLPCWLLNICQKYGRLLLLLLLIFLFLLLPFCCLFFLLLFFC